MGVWTVIGVFKAVFWEKLILKKNGREPPFGTDTASAVSGQGPQPSLRLLGAEKLKLRPSMKRAKSRSVYGWP